MIPTLLILSLFLLVGMVKTNNNLEYLIKTMADANERLAGVESRLDEASAEILAEIASLRSAETLSEAGSATLDRIEAKAQALADVVPNAPPTP